MKLSVNVRHDNTTYRSGSRDISEVVVNHDYERGNGAYIALTDKESATIISLIFHAPGTMDKFVTDLANVIGEGGEEMVI